MKKKEFWIVNNAFPSTASQLLKYLFSYWHRLLKAGEEAESFSSVIPDISI
jgi:hypothetical protein